MPPRLWDLSYELLECFYARLPKGLKSCHQHGQKFRIRGRRDLCAGTQKGTWASQRPPCHLQASARGWEGLYQGMTSLWKVRPSNGSKLSKSWCRSDAQGIGFSWETRFVGREQHQRQLPFLFEPGESFGRRRVAINRISSGAMVWGGLDGATTYRKMKYWLLD